MLKQINLLLYSFNDEPVDYQFNIHVWWQVIALYRLSDKSNQDYLIAELAKRFSITNKQLSTSLESVVLDSTSQETIQLTLEELHKAQRSAEEQKIIAFKQRAFKHIPKLDSFEVNRVEWLELIHRYEKRGFKRLTNNFMMVHLSSVKKIDYEILIVALHKEQLQRPTKRSFASTSLFQQPIKKRKCFHYDVPENKENLPILANTPENVHLHSPLRKTGVRILDLTPASPERGYKNLQKTSNEEKVRSYFKNGESELFKLLTPRKSTADAGKTNLTEIKQKLPHLLFFPDYKPISFKATLDKLQARKSVKRRVGQNEITGVSCCDVFKAHDIEVIVTSRGSKYHWSHLIAHFLGGAQSRENLIPGTAVSNYNTLELVERFIAFKLMNHEADFIDIQVKANYDDKLLIPNELVFQLSWQSTIDNRFHFEIISINPRSYERITSSMHKSVEKLRERDRGSELGMTIL